MTIRVVSKSRRRWLFEPLVTSRSRKMSSGDTKKSSSGHFGTAHSFAYSLLTSGVLGSGLSTIGLCKLSLPENLRGPIGVLIFGPVENLGILIDLRLGLLGEATAGTPAESTKIECRLCTLMIASSMDVLLGPATLGMGGSTRFWGTSFGASGIGLSRGTL